MRYPSILTRIKRMAAFISASVLFTSVLYPVLYCLSEKTHFLNEIKGTGVGCKVLVPEESRLMPSDFQASIGLCQVKKLKENRLRREKIIERYHRELIKLDRNLVEMPPYNTHISHFPILSDYRDELADFLLRRGIHATNVFREMPGDLPLLQKYCYTEYKQAKSITDRCLLLPLYTQLKEEHQKKVIDTMLEWQAKKTNLGAEI